MVEEVVEIEIDGRSLKARKGAMLIEVADVAGINIPRFCYHKELSIAANCRMCLVEVERAAKPVPACATPVAPGMRVFTRSSLAIAAQRGTMEFLLINHPLDCPICDQGGECELQDLAMGYGEGVSRYTERKRVVADKDIGPLIATDMTRCIHCTRCVRFGQEIAGLPELGATGRGEQMQIGTYVEKSVVSELSGNVIDLCPVGALTAKPSRYTARSWELTQHVSIAPHDCVGSNIYFHTRGGRVMRAVPRENEPVNEVWISDRDRFSYTALYADDRLTKPIVKVNGLWQEVEWDTAVSAAADILLSGVQSHGPEKLGALVSPIWTIEEQYLAQKLIRALGSNNVDHRLRQLDFSDQDRAPVMPWLGGGFQDLEDLEAALIAGSNIRKEQPLLALRLRKAVLKGAKISFVNPRRYEFLFDVVENCVVEPGSMARELAAIAATLHEHSFKNTEVPSSLVPLIESAKITDKHRHVAQGLLEAERSAVILGNSAVSNPNFAALRALASFICGLANARLGYFPEGGNVAGAWLAGCIPHRGPGSTVVPETGLHAYAMIEQPLKVYLLAGVEPEYDCANAAMASRAMGRAEKIIAFTPFASELMRQYADVLLPVAVFAETSGTFVNAAGMWQDFREAGRPPGEARPAWKVLRVLAGALGLDGFDYLSSEEIRSELKAKCREIVLDNRVDLPSELPVSSREGGLVRGADIPIYAVDPIVRRADPLQSTTDAVCATARMAKSQADQLGLVDGQQVIVRQGDDHATLAVEIDSSIPLGCVWIPASLEGSLSLGSFYGPVELEATPVLLE